MDKINSYQQGDVNFSRAILSEFSKGILDIKNCYKFNFEA